MRSSFSSSSPYLYLSLFRPVPIYLSFCQSVCLCLFVSVFLSFRRNLQMQFRSKYGQTLSDSNITSVHSQKTQTRKCFTQINNAGMLHPTYSIRTAFVQNVRGHCNKEVCSGSANTGRRSGDHTQNRQIRFFMVQQYPLCCSGGILANTCPPAPPPPTHPPLPPVLFYFFCFCTLTTMFVSLHYLTRL